MTWGGTERPPYAAIKSSEERLDQRRRAQGRVVGGRRLGRQRNRKGRGERNGAGQRIDQAGRRYGRVQGEETALGGTGEECIGQVRVRRPIIVPVMLRGMQATNGDRIHVGRWLGMFVFCVQDVCGVVVQRRMIQGDMHVRSDAQPECK